MSTVEKLLIRGIRSFDPDSQNVIEFYSPLTLIVGKNGCGKTTVIECLKYATTGVLPPNSKGGAFIHDPKLAGEVEIKAQVKLKFKNINSKDMVCTRSLQATQKKTGISMQTLESVLVISKDKATGQESSSISTKCADLDTEMPLQLGISKAILENVIFCHQEESNWPLSEPTVLKKRFDDIFSAARYTKAVDTLKKLRKDQTVELKIQSNDLRHSEENKKNDLISKITELEYSEKICQKKILEFEDMIQEFTTSKSSLKKHEYEKGMFEENIKEILQHTDLIHESKDELENVLSEQEYKNKDIQENINSYNKKIDNLSQEIEKFRAEISQNQLKLGKYQSLKVVYDKELQNRQNLVLEIYSKHDQELSPLFKSQSLIKINVNKFLAEQIQIVFKYVNENYKDYSDNIIRIKSEISENQNTFTDKSQSLNLLKAQNDQIILQIGEQVHDKELRIKNIKNSIDATSNCVDELQVLNNRTLHEETNLKAALEERNTANIPLKIQALREELCQIDDDITIVSDEATKIQENSELLAKSDIFKKSIEAKNKDLEEISCIIKMDCFFVARFGSDIDIETSVKSINNVKSYLKDENQQINDTYRTLDINIASSKSKLLDLENNLLDLKKELQDKKNILTQHINDESYETCVQRLQQNADQILEDVAKNKSIKLVYKEYINEFKTSSACPLCVRTWDNSKDKDIFEAKLQDKYNQSPSLTEQAENQLKLAQLAINKIKNLHPIVEDVTNLKTKTIPLLLNELSVLKIKIDTLLVDLVKVKKEKSISDKKCDDFEKLLIKFNKWIKINNELGLEKIEHQNILDSLEKSGLSKSVTVSKKNLSGLQAKSRIVRDKIDSFTDQSISFQKKISMLEKTIADYKNESSHLKQKLEQRKLDIELKTQTLAEIDVLKKKIEDAKTSTEMADEKFIYEKKDIDNIAHTLKKNLDKNSKEYAYWENLSKKLDDLNNSILKFEQDGDINEKLNGTIEMIEQITIKITKSQTEILHFRSKLSENEKWKVNHEQKLRQIYDNLKIRKLEDDIIQKKNQIIDTLDNIKIIETKILKIIKDFSSESYISNFIVLSKKNKKILELMNSFDPNDKDYVNKYNIENSNKRSINKETGHQSYPQKKSNMLINSELLNDFKAELRSVLDKISVNKASLIGEKKQIETQINHYLNELKSNYKNIDNLYVEKMISFQSLELAQTDLEKYTKALDNAIMQYHSLKMQEINKIIRELWVNTYTANDIDTIEIRSESETTKANRSYNYRVVMIKGGQPIDMRGRCSAGQKVLASLIIRLALAETFALNCGILALDEPTTNLDKSNVESLAYSLSRIISSRNKKSKFQFIIITHDEDFLDLLGKSDLADYYWRVYKNQRQVRLLIIENVETQQVAQRIQQVARAPVTDLLYYSELLEVNTLVEELQKITEFYVEKDEPIAQRSPIWAITEPTHIHQDFEAHIDMSKNQGVRILNQRINFEANLSGTQQINRAWIQDQQQEATYDFYTINPTLNDNNKFKINDLKGTLKQDLELEREPARILRIKDQLKLWNSQSFIPDTPYIKFLQMRAILPEDQHNNKIRLKTNSSNRKINSDILGQYEIISICKETGRYYFRKITEDSRSHMEILHKEKHPPVDVIYYNIDRSGGCTAKTNCTDRVVYFNGNIQKYQKYQQCIWPTRYRSIFFEEKQENSELLQLVQKHTRNKNKRTLALLKKMKEPVLFPTMELNISSITESDTRENNINIIIFYWNLAIWFPTLIRLAKSDPVRIEAFEIVSDSRSKKSTLNTNKIWALAAFEIIGAP
ncbi:hypothetical protein BB561_003017 [Smittium simulii]|uniref:DNA repair protein RAD50 n=1 Tax=Smittium simulii TaxID=133385 RepID=A0A2T9YNA8_9FUNG|nr:hypothetical protein BB561_003017 [Smittium simulii]